MTSDNQTPDNQDIDMFNPIDNVRPAAAVRRLFLLGTVALGAGACGDSPTSTPAEPFVPAAIELHQQSVQVESLREGIQLQALITDDAGQPGAGVPVEWSSSDPSILESLGDGRFVSVANGEAAVVARVPRSGQPPLEATAAVMIEQLPVEVAVVRDPDEDAPLEEFELWSLGQSFDLLGTPRDAMGSPMADPQHPLEWSSSDPEVASVDASGRIVARNPGSTRLLVTYGALSASVEVSVSPELRLESCARFTMDSSAIEPGERESCAVASLAFSERDTDG